MRAGASSVSVRTALSRQRPAAGAERVLGVQRRRVVLGERRRDAALRVPAVRGCDRALREQQHLGLRGGRRAPRRARRRRRRRRPGHATLESHEVFSSKSITCPRVYMVSDPRAKTAAPAHTVLAVVCRCATAGSQVLLWERALDPFAGLLVAPGRRARRRRDARGSRSAATSRRRSTCASSRTSSSSRRCSDPGRNPLRWELATAYLGLVPTRRRPGAPADTRWHPVDDLPRARVRPRADRARRPRAAARRSSRTRTSASRSRRRRSRSPSCATSTAPRSATTSRPRTCSACSSGGRPAGDGRTPRAGADGRPPGRALPLRPPGVPDHRPVRRAAATADPTRSKPFLAERARGHDRVTLSC